MMKENSPANNSRKQPQLALDSTTPKNSVDGSLITTNNLKKKVWNQPLLISNIVEVNLYPYNPDFLAAKYKDYREDQLYIFTQRDPKYKYEYRINRAAGNGYWKVIGADKQIKSNETVVGYRKPLLFYTGKAPKGDKTDWIMYEFRLEDSACSERGSNGMRLDDWVLRKIYHKPIQLTKTQTEDDVPSKDDYGEGDDDIRYIDDQMNCGNIEGANITDVKSSSSCNIPSEF